MTMQILNYFIFANYPLCVPPFNLFLLLFQVVSLHLFALPKLDEHCDWLADSGEYPSQCEPDNCHIYL